MSSTIPEVISPIQYGNKTAAPLRSTSPFSGRRPDGSGNSITPSSTSPPTTTATITTDTQARTNISEDKATLAFIRRTLCGQHLYNVTSEALRTDPPSVDELLPPLTSLNEVDLQLYAFIAIIINEFVYPWYARITSDHVFVDEVVQIIAHCTRALEERLRKLDFETLLLDEVPRLIDAHIHASRTARQAASVSGPPVTARVVYHTLRPHPALSPVPDEEDPASVLEQQQNDAAYRTLLAQGVIAVLLPTEDLRNPCLRSLVSEIFGDFILGNFLGGRLCDATFIYESIRKAADLVQSKTDTKRWALEPSTEPKDRLARYGLLGEQRKSNNLGSGQRSISDWFWTIAQYIYATFIAMRWLVKLFTTPLHNGTHTIISSPNTPQAEQPTGSNTSRLMITSEEPRLSTELKDRPAVLTLHLWPTIASAIDLHPHMPWLTGCIALAQHFLLNGPGRVGSSGSRLDRLLRYHLISPLLDPPSKHIPYILLTLRTNLFPNNGMPPSQIAIPTPIAPTSPMGTSGPTATAMSSGTYPNTTPITGAIPTSSPSAEAEAEAAAQTRRAAAFAILNLLPPALARFYFRGLSPLFPSYTSSISPSLTASIPPSEEEREGLEIEQMVAAVESLLDTLVGDEYMTRHLVYAVLERVVAGVVPELAGISGGGSIGSGMKSGMGMGVGELLAERGVEV